MRVIERQDICKVIESGEARDRWRVAIPQGLACLVQQNKLRIGLDYHGVLDVGCPKYPYPEDWIPNAWSRVRGKDLAHPAPHIVRFVQKLLSAGLVPYIVSYCGSAEREYGVELFRRELAIAVGYPTHAKPQGPTLQGLFCTFPPARVGGLPGSEGKAAVLSHYKTYIHVDDRENIVTECQEAGILAYQLIFWPRDRSEPRFPVARTLRATDVPLEFIHSADQRSDPRERSFGAPQRVCCSIDCLGDYIASELLSGAVAWRLQALAEHRNLGPDTQLFKAPPAAANTIEQTQADLAAREAVRSSNR